MSDQPERPSLLSKTNPNATTRSVLIHSLWGALGGVGLWFVLFVGGKAPLWSIIPWVPFGAFIAGILEWQMDDSLDSGDEFDEFVDRFVPIYWQDVLDNNHKLPPYEPCEQTLDEVLAETKYRTSRETADGGVGDVYVLRMFAPLGSTWRFVFKQTAGRWELLEAFANDETDEYRCDMLDEVYGPYFREMLERTTALASRGPSS